MATRSVSIDTTHSSVGFTVRHLVISKVRGNFTAWEGAIHLDDDLARSSVEVSIDVASVDTGTAKRDEHLRSADFFDAEHHPKLTFVSKQVLVEGDKVVQVIGDLTIRGTTRQVTLEVEDLGTVKDPWGGTRVAWSASLSINRTDFGLTWNQLLELGGVAVSEKVEISLEVQGVVQAAKAA